MSSGNAAILAIEKAIKYKQNKGSISSKYRLSSSYQLGVLKCIFHGIAPNSEMAKLMTVLRFLRKLFGANCNGLLGWGMEERGRGTAAVCSVLWLNLAAYAARMAHLPDAISIFMYAQFVSMRLPLATCHLLHTAWHGEQPVPLCHCLSACPSVRPSVCLSGQLALLWSSVAGATSTRNQGGRGGAQLQRMLEQRGIVNDCSEARGNYKMHLMDFAKKATFIGPVDAAAGSQGGSKGAGRGP